MRLVSLRTVAGPRERPRERCPGPADELEAHAQSEGGRPRHVGDEERLTRLGVRRARLGRHVLEEIRVGEEIEHFKRRLDLEPADRYRPGQLQIRPVDRIAHEVVARR